MGDLYQIYLITDTTNGKKYVGQVIQHRGYLTRFNEHLNGVKHANTRLLSNAIKKRGKEKFQVQLIEDNILESDIDNKEKYYIRYFNTFYSNKQGYNMTEGGQGVHGYKHTLADREKLSKTSKESWKKFKNDPEKLLERNMKISKKLKGRMKSDKTKQHLSEAAIKRFQNQPGTFTGKKHSALSKRLIAEKNGYKVGMYDKNSNELLKTFISTCEAGRYLVDNNLTKNISCATRIRTICNQIKGQGKTAYGYVWRYLK